MKLLIPNPGELKSAIISLADHYDTFCFLDSNSTSGEINWIAGMGISQYLRTEYNHFNEASNFFLANQGKYMFGHLNYDLKNEFENLTSAHSNTVAFELFDFFVPEIVLVAIGNDLEIVCYESASEQSRSIVHDLVKGQKPGGLLKKNNVIKSSRKIKLKSRTSKKTYLENCTKILEYLKAGDIYELNYCVEFYDDDAAIDPVKIYEKLSDLAQAPMSCFYKNKNNYLISASPERFLKRQDNKLISQPMKGTIRRSSGSGQLAGGNGIAIQETSNFQSPVSGFENDEQLKSILYHDEKERSENVMIVDLVRNDLSKVADKGSVSVDELFGIYTFKTVHQMISTVSCMVRKETTFTDIIKALFPMGSMTGAPKIRAMQLIEEYEEAKRGLFSGSVGYIAPNGDFDFNVVIRSIFYNETARYLSTWAGSAITINSVPEKEYEECLLKLQAMIKALA